jgi:CheY-like chemotaxis protein
LVEGLRELGYRVSEASDGPQALAIMATDPSIDVVVTDDVMPQGMTGRELSRRIGRLKPTIKLVLISGNVAATDEERVQFPVLRKPIGQAALHQAIQHALRR